ncbi:sensor histidine kinase [Paenibacillus thiaminolyticus]
MRLTLLTGCIVILTAVCVTLISIHNAESKFVKPFTAGAVPMNRTEGDLSEFMKEIEIGAHPDTMEGEKGDKGELNNISVQVSTIEANERFVNASVIYMFIIIAFGMAATYAIAGRALRPVNQLSTTIRNINENNLSQRLVPISTNDEIGSLADSFNTMLNRLDESFTRQKRFASNAAHELKTPLATIKAGIQVLKLDESPSIEDYRETVDITEQSTQRLIDVVEDLLHLTADSQESATDVIDLSEALQPIEQELEPLRKQKRVQIQIGECSHPIVGNKTLVYRVLFNLIENAVKYNTPGGKVQISTARRGSHTIIQISDTGIGMRDEELPHIFEPFYRVDKSRSRNIAGSGLGLSIVKAIMEKHNGFIKVQSRPDVGTTFEAAFPTLSK